MAKQRNRRYHEVTQPTVFEEARDEMFQQIMQCGVIGAEPDHQGEWFRGTMAYLSDRYPELSSAQLVELRTLGDRFVQPPKRATADIDNSSATAA
jgi:hypothetical protein